METIASNDFYRIGVDKSKNRLVIVMRGMWIKEQDLVAWVDDVVRATGLLSPGFTVLSDMTCMEGTMLSDLVGDAQKELMKAGISKCAAFYDRESFLKLQMERLTEQTKYPVKRFLDKNEAEAWLDES